MKLGSWEEISIGGIIDKPKSAESFPTGTWATLQPVIDFNICVHCLICWVYCPDSCFYIKDGKIDIEKNGVDLFHCKGCGICEEVCPKKCIKMIPVKI